MKGLMERDTVSTLRSQYRGTKATRYLIGIVYLFFCLGVVGIPGDRRGQLYLLALVSLVGAIYLAVTFACRVLTCPSWIAELSRETESSLLVAALLGTIAILVVETAHLSSTPRAAFASWYSLILFSACPLPFCLGEDLFHEVAVRERILILASVVLSSILSGRLMLLFPTAFMLAELDSPQVRVGGDLTGRMKARGFVTLTALAAAALILFH